MSEEIKTPSEQTEKTYSEKEYEALAEQLRSAEEKWKKSESDRKAFEYRTKLAFYVKGLRLRDEVYEAYVTKLLEEKGLKFDGNRLIGGDDAVQDFRKDHEYAFIPDSEERVSSSTSGRVPRTANAVEQAFYAKNPQLVPEN